MTAEFLPSEHERNMLALWHNTLDFYGRDWDQTFEKDDVYYRKEFWYLLVDCVINYWRGNPLTVGSAIKIMQGRSKRTRDHRIKAAELDGLIIRRKQTNDRRETLLIPSPILEQKIYEHFKRTLEHALKTLSEIQLLTDD